MGDDTLTPLQSELLLVIARPTGASVKMLAKVCGPSAGRSLASLIRRRLVSVGAGGRYFLTPLGRDVAKHASGE